MLPLWCRPACLPRPALQLSQANPRNREGARYATRSVLLLAAYLQALGQYGEATAALMKAHFQVAQGG